VILSLSGFGQLIESESVKSIPQRLIVNPAVKKPSFTNFSITISGIITLRMKRKVLINQGTIHAFLTNKLITLTTDLKANVNFRFKKIMH